MASNLAAEATPASKRVRGHSAMVRTFPISPRAPLVRLSTSPVDAGAALRSSDGQGGIGGARRSAGEGRLVGKPFVERTSSEAALPVRRCCRETRTEQRSVLRYSGRELRARRSSSRQITSDPVIPRADRHDTLTRLVYSLSFISAQADHSPVLHFELYPSFRPLQSLSLAPSTPHGGSKLIVVSYNQLTSFSTRSSGFQVCRYWSFRQSDAERAQLDDPEDRRPRVQEGQSPHPLTHSLRRNSDSDFV